MADAGNRKRRSPYYSHFQMAETGELNRKKATCNYCPQVLSCYDKGCTGNLARHIRQKHPEIMTAIEEEQAKLNAPEEYDVFEESTRSNNGSPSSSVYVLNVSDEDCHSQDGKYLKPRQMEREKRIKRENPFESYPESGAKMLKMAAAANVNREISQEGTMADRFDIFGSLVAVKMRGLDREQMILAEKLINDTLHEAEMNNLTRFCTLNLAHMDMVDESKPDVLG